MRDSGWQPWACDKSFEPTAAIAGPGRSKPVGALDAIIATVVRFRGTARQSNDMTMMLVSREGAA